MEMCFSLVENRYRIWFCSDPGVSNSCRGGSVRGVGNLPVYAMFDHFAFAPPALLPGSLSASPLIHFNF